MSRPRVTLIAAMAEGRVIGRDNAMPWHLPEDLRHFKAETLGKPVLMGRKTFESIGRPLPGRRNIVVTRQTDWQHAGVEVVHGVEAGLALAGDVPEICVIGGADIYRQLLPVADCLKLTEIAATYDGDARFPDFADQGFEAVSRVAGVSETGLAYAFVEWRRR